MSIDKKIDHVAVLSDVAAELTTLRMMEADVAAIMREHYGTGRPAEWLRKRIESDKAIVTRMHDALNNIRKTMGVDTDDEIVPWIRESAAIRRAVGKGEM